MKCINKSFDLEYTIYSNFFIGPLSIQNNISKFQRVQNINSLEQTIIVTYRWKKKSRYNFEVFDFWNSWWYAKIES